MATLRPDMVIMYFILCCKKSNSETDYSLEENIMLLLVCCKNCPKLSFAVYLEQFSYH